MWSVAARAKLQHDEAERFAYTGWETRASFHRRLFESELKKAIKAGVNQDGDGFAYQFADGSRLVLFDYSADGGGTECINAWRREDKEWFRLIMEDADNVNLGL